MNKIPESELILDKRGAIYHLGVRPDELADTVIVVGDPDRVPIVSKYFDTIEHRLQHREFITHTGSFIIGILYALSLKQNAVAETTLLFLVTGICGGYTTFSTFSLENIQLLQSGKILTAILYSLSSLAGGLLACWLGYKLLQVK